jgi:CRP/FNR family transcriptional regulator
MLQSLNIKRMSGNTPENTGCAHCHFKCIFPCLIADDPGHDHHIREITFRKGEILFKQGTFGSKIIFIREGLVKIFMEGGNKNLLAKFHTGNMYLGLNQLNRKNESNYSAIALKDTKVCMIEINFFKKQSRTNQKLRDMIIDLFAYENEFMRKRLLVIGTRNNLGKLTNTLIYLMEEELVKEDVYHYITRKDIADLSNMSVESLERLLGELKREGVISMKGKYFEITDIKNIREHATIGYPKYVFRLISDRHVWPCHVAVKRLLPHP